MNGVERAELRALAEAATPGPWEVQGRAVSACNWIDGGDYDEVLAPAEVACLSYCYGGSSRIALGDDDAAFIAAARTAVPALLDALAEAEREWRASAAHVEQAEAELARLRDGKDGPP